MCSLYNCAFHEWSTQSVPRTNYFFTTKFIGFGAVHNFLLCDWFSKQQRNLPVKHKSKHKMAICTPRRRTFVVVYLSMNCSPQILNYLSLVSKPNEAQPITAILISLEVAHAQSHSYHVNSSDSELPVLEFSRAYNFCRACAVRKLGIWERDWVNC